MVDKPPIYGDDRGMVYGIVLPTLLNHRTMANSGYFNWLWPSGSRGWNQRSPYFPKKCWLTSSTYLNIPIFDIIFASKRWNPLFSWWILVKHAEKCPFGTNRGATLAYHLSRRFSCLNHLSMRKRTIILGLSPNFLWGDMTKSTIFIAEPFWNMLFHPISLSPISSNDLPIEISPQKIPTASTRAPQQSPLLDRALHLPDLLCALHRTLQVLWMDAPARVEWKGGLGAGAWASKAPVMGNKRKFEKRWESHEKMLGF